MLLVMIVLVILWWCSVIVATGLWSEIGRSMSGGEEYKEEFRDVLVKWMNYLLLDFLLIFCRINCLLQYYM